MDVLNRFSIDAYAMGNWDWVYGVDRALELFAGPSAKAPWNAVAANAYYDGEPYAGQTGSRLLPPYLIREIAGVKIGILGFTTDRGPQVVGRGRHQGGSLHQRRCRAQRIRHAAARTGKGRAHYRAVRARPFQQYSTGGAEPPAST